MKVVMAYTVEWSMFEDLRCLDIRGPEGQWHSVHTLTADEHIDHDDIAIHIQHRLEEITSYVMYREHTHQDP